MKTKPDAHLRFQHPIRFLTEEINICISLSTSNFVFYRALFLDAYNA